MYDVVQRALSAIAAGQTPDSQEGAHLDFKEDPARAAHPRGNPEAHRLQILLDAAICFANADGESFIVLGLRDKAKCECHRLSLRVRLLVPLDPVIELQGLSSPHARARPARGTPARAPGPSDAYRTPTAASDRTGEAC